MKKLIVVCGAVVVSSLFQLVQAQTSVNKINVNNPEHHPVEFIDGISFTPDGILRTSVSGGTKSVRPADAPVVLIKEEVSAIEKLSTLQFKYAMLIDVEVESLKNLSLFGFIEDWFGTRYKYGGETKKGIDCSALTGTLLLAVYGFAVPRTARQQYEATQRIEKNELNEGDLVFFNTTGGISHVGLYLKNNYFVHASSSQGVTISSLEDNYYSRRYIGAGRIQNDGHPITAKVNDQKSDNLL